jgi:hypothetical protein
MLGILARPVSAQVIFYDNTTAFEASSTTSVAVTFDGFTPTNVDIQIPPQLPISLGGVTFTPGDVGPGESPNLLVATPTATAGVVFSTPRTSNVLTCSGDENIDMAFSTGPTAVGFDTYLNSFTPPTVSVYDLHGNLLATHVLIQAPGTKGFPGIISAVSIGKVNWSADDRIDTGRGVDTGIDNVRVGVTRPHTLTFYLRGHDIPETAGGFTMNQTPASSQMLAVNLGINAPSWFSDPILDGIVLPGATFKLAPPRTAGLNFAITYRLEITNPDGSGAQRLGEVTQVLSVGLGTQTITIPVSTPVVFNNQRLKLTISSIAGNPQISVLLAAAGFLCLRLLPCWRRLPVKVKPFRLGLRTGLRLGASGENVIRDAPTGFLAAWFSGCDRLQPEFLHLRGPLPVMV